MSQAFQGNYAHSKSMSLLLLKTPAPAFKQMAAGGYYRKLHLRDLNAALHGCREFGCEDFGCEDIGCGDFVNKLPKLTAILDGSQNCLEEQYWSAWPKWPRWPDWNCDAVCRPVHAHVLAALQVTMSLTS